MNADNDYIREFLAHMGIEADITRDSRNQKVIVIPTDEYQKRRAWIETWFTLVEQRDQYCYFHERPRGTGQTI